MDERETATLLVEMAKSGDELAFGRLVDRYRPRIYALALHMTGSESEADDIAQEVFLKAYRKLDRFEGRSHFFTWVYRMAVNQSINAARSRKRKRETEYDPRLHRALQVDAREDQHKRVELKETYAKLLGALDKLPEDMRSAVVLVTLQGLSHGEAAVVLDCAEKTISWRIHAARKRLRAALKRPLPADALEKKSLADWMDRWGLVPKPAL